MSGAKRRSGYRKSVSSSALEGRPEPTAGQRIAQVSAMLGANLLQVSVAASPAAPASPPAPGVALLPTKFRNAVWVRKGGFLIVREADDEGNAAGAGSGGAALAVRFIVEHVLFADQVRHLRAHGLWPAAFGDGVAVALDAAPDVVHESDEDDEDEDEDEEENEGGSDAFGAAAGRRGPRQRVQAPRVRAGDLPDLETSAYERRRRRPLTLEDLRLRRLAPCEVDDAYTLLAESGLLLERGSAPHHLRPLFSSVEAMRSRAAEEEVYAAMLRPDAEAEEAEADADDGDGDGDGKGRVSGATVATFTVGTKCWRPYIADLPRGSWDADAGVSFDGRGDGSACALYLGELAVSPSLRRRGLARALLARVDEIARERGCVAVRLDAAGALPWLRELFERCGYSLRGSVPVPDAEGACEEFDLFEKVLK